MAQNKVTYTISADAAKLSSALDSLKRKAADLQSSISSISGAFKGISSGSSGKRALTDAEKEVRVRRDALNLQRVELAELKTAEQFKRLAERERARAASAQRKTARSQQVADRDAAKAALEARRSLEQQIRQQAKLQAFIRRTREETQRLRRENRTKTALGGVTANQAFFNLGGGIADAVRAQRAQEKVDRKNAIDAARAERASERERVRAAKESQRELRKTEIAAAKTRAQIAAAFNDNPLVNFARRVRDITSALILFNTVRGVANSFLAARDFIIDTNTAVQDARIGIASTITAAGEYVDTLGEALPIAQQVALALGEADAIIPRLLKISSERGLGFDALLQTQTATAGFTKASGFTPDQTVETIASVAFFSEKLGISQGRVVRTLDNIIKGYRVSQTELGTALGLSDKIVASLREQGDLAKGLIKLLSGTAEASKKNLETYNGIKTAIESTLKSITLATTGGLFASIQEAYTSLLGLLKEVQNDPERLENIRGIFDAVGDDIASISKSIMETARELGGMDLAGQYRDIKNELATGLIDGSVGWLLAGMLQLGGMLPQGRAIRIGAAVLGATGQPSSILPENAFGRGRLQGDLNREDIARSRANTVLAQALRGSGGGSMDALIAALTLGPSVQPNEPKIGFNQRTFIEDDGSVAGSSRGRGGSRSTARQLTRAESFERALADESRLREQVLAEELSAIERGNIGMSDRVRIAESELRVIEAKGGSITDQLAKQNEINDLKREELDLEIKILEAKVRRIEDELPRVPDDLFVDLQNQQIELQDQLNAKKSDQIVLENEIAAAAKLTVKERSKEAETLSDIVKGLRDGVKITDLLMGIGRQAGDKMIDNFVDAILGEAKTGSSASGGSGGGLLGNLSSMFGSGGNAPAAGTTGPPAPSIANGGSSLGALGSGAAGIIGGATTGAGFASMGGLFGASEREQKAGTIGGAAGGAVGAAIGTAIFPVIGTALGGMIGGMIGTISGFLAEALGIFKGPSTSRVVRKRLGESIESSGLPSLRGKPGDSLSAGALGESALARFLTLDESGREIKLGRGGFNAQQSASDVLDAIGVSTTGLSERDKQAALSRVLGTASGGLDEGLDRLAGRRTERLSNISDRVNRAQTTADMIRAMGSTSSATSIKVGNETIPLDANALAQYRENAIKETNATFRAELADFIDAIDEIPAAVDGATLAFAALGTDGVLNLERLKDSIEDTSSLIETGFTNGIKALAEGSSIRDAVQQVDDAYQEIATDRFTQRFIEERKLDPNFTKSVDLTNQAIDAYMAGDTVTAARLFNEAQGARSASNSTAAREFAEMSPFLRMINTGTVGNGGVQLPMFMQPNGGVDNGARTIELLEEQNYLLRNGGGQSGSVATVTNNTEVRVSSREISDAEKNAYNRQSSGTRRPNPNVGVSQ